MGHLNLIVTRHHKVDVLIDIEELISDYGEDINAIIDALSNIKLEISCKVLEERGKSKVLITFDGPRIFFLQKSSKYNSSSSGK